MDSLEQVLQSQTDVKVVDARSFVALDLSVSNNNLLGVDTNSAAAFENFVDNHVCAHSAEAAFGGYNEQRNLYRRSDLFSNSDEDERDIHIGLDIWMRSESPVFAALNGTVHSFDYNAGIGNYGPTIILEHQIDGEIFYTLYGHLSLESIEEIEIGDVFNKGQRLAALGDPSVNGDYAPHLHFQIIRDIEDNFGDYPGVCSKADLNFYLQNCPDPNLLLKLNQPL